jgi:hypothetical protein
VKSRGKELWSEVSRGRGLINTTPVMESRLKDSGVKEGLPLCNALRIAASVGKVTGLTQNGVSY